MKFLEGLSLLLIGLQLSGLISISWWLIILPLFLQWVIIPICVGVFVGLAVTIIDSSNGNDKLKECVLSAFIKNATGKSK